ncbi:MAG: hypothetical protein J0M26_19740 [Planctomycetes bacterium]|nr:hypothetical protein [Planctomycetota bacterium]
MIKWSIISLCGFGILLTWLLTEAILAVNAAHGHSVVREFEILELIDRAKLEELRKLPSHKDYSIDKRVKDIGATKFHFGVFRIVLTCLFVVITLLALAVPKPDQKGRASTKSD